MARYEYGSQRELLQHVIDPRHRQRINRELLEANVELREFATGPADITWLAPDPTTGRELKDDAWAVIGLSDPSPQTAKWWPRSGPTWDGVAGVRGRDGSIGAIFVEAKARARELRSGGCKSTDPGNRKMITEALRDVQAELDVPVGTNWLGPVYQPANRLAWLWFGRCHEQHRARPVPVWLLSLYFCDVQYRRVTGMVGPRDENAWRSEVDAIRAELRLPARHSLSDRCIELFMPSVVTELQPGRGR